MKYIIVAFQCTGYRGFHSDVKSRIEQVHQKLFLDAEHLLLSEMIWGALCKISTS